MRKYVFSVLGRDEHLALFLYYKRLFESSQWELTFPDGSIKNPHDATALLLDSGTTHTVAQYGGRVLSVVRLDGFHGKVAHVHFSFLPGLSRGTVREIGRQYLDWVFEKFGRTTLLGLIPVYNFPAINFAKSLGFSSMGRLEDGAYSSKHGFCDLVVLKKVQRHEVENTAV